jgi:NTE family protein
MKKKALVLGGGFASNAYHAGVLKVLDNHNIKFDCIAASSMASITAALYAAGKSPREIMQCLLDIKRSDIFCIREFIRAGKDITTGKKLMAKIKKHLKVSDFSELDTPLVLTALDLKTMQEIRLAQGDLLTSLNSAIAYGLFFKEVKHEDKLLMDIGFMNPVPVNLVKEDHHTIASAILPKYKPPKKLSIREMYRATIVLYGNDVYDMKLDIDPADCLVRLESDSYSDWTFDRNKLILLYNEGKKRALSIIDDILEEQKDIR